MKKLPNILSTEELLKALEDNTLIVDELVNNYQSPDDSDVLNFISKFSIYPGTNKIKLSLLYRLYKLSFLNPVSNISFNKVIQDYVQYEMHNEQLHVFINQDPLKLLESIKLEHRKATKRKRTDLKHDVRFEQFIKHYKIKRGLRPVDSSTLYYFYDKWSYENKKREIPYSRFNALCRLHFETKVTKHIQCMAFVNVDFFRSIPRPEMITAIAWGKKFRAKKEK